MSGLRFDEATLDLLDAEREVRVETVAPDGKPQSTVIWVVVDDGEAFVRSWLGDRGRWYRAALARPDDVTLVARDRSIPVVAAAATDDVSIARCSSALERKYAGDPSTPGMVRPDVLGTTLRLEPRGG